MPKRSVVLLFLPSWALGGVYPLFSLEAGKDLAWLPCRGAGAYSAQAGPMWASRGEASTPHPAPPSLPSLFLSTRFPNGYLRPFRNHRSCQLL